MHHYCQYHQHTLHLMLKKLYLRLSVRSDELLSTLKIITFLAKSSTKLLKWAPSNAIPLALYTYLILSLVFTILVAPNKQFFKFKIVKQNLWLIIIIMLDISISNFGCMIVLLYNLRGVIELYPYFVTKIF